MAVTKEVHPLHAGHKEETGPVKPPLAAEEKPKDKYTTLLETVKWIHEWARYNDLNVRQRTTKALQSVGELKDAE